MSRGTIITSADQLPILPETDVIEPLVQCGVLYLGTALPGAGLRGLDSIQEPFSHRYPVDGTNTVRGIDAVISVYDNGIQLAFARQPHAVIFFPITSLIYCASLRFTTIENDETKQSSLIDWRFMPLDRFIINDNKHPPLFSIVLQRTQISSGDECHCFITKSTDAALALVQSISQIYANLKFGNKCLKSPIFYQLDRFGRKISETNGIIYISPDNDDDSQLNRITNSNNLNPLRNESIIQDYLFDPSLNGFFYRTDASLIEQWQLWDDDDLIGSRPRPPASPFGLHEGLYHDDTTHEIQKYLRHMEDEEPSSSCSCSSKSSISSRLSSPSSSSSSSSTSSSLTEHSRRPSRNHHHKQRTTSDTDQFNTSFANLQTSSFQPVLTEDNNETNKTQQAPIIIEKIVPNPFPAIPILNPKLSEQHRKYILESPQQSFDSSNCLQESNINYIPSSDLPFLSYQINERGEKITKEGNRIIFMDVIQPNINNTKSDVQADIRPIRTSRRRLHRSHRQQPSSIPVIDIQSIERLFNEKKIKQQRHKNLNNDEKFKDYSNEKNHLTTSDMLEIVDGYFEDFYGQKIQLNNHDAQNMLDHLQSSTEKKQRRRKSSIISSKNSSKNETHRRRSHSTLTIGPSVNYVERSLIPSSSENEKKVHSSLSPIKPKYPIPSILTNEQVNEYVSNIYGTARSIKSSTPSSTNHQEIKSLNNITTTNPDYISPFRYMQSSINPNLIREYRGIFG